jgi:hypothetical protein
MIMMMKPSEHLKRDRLDRYVFIATEIGFGTIKYEQYDSKCKRWLCLTDTAVTYIMDEKKTTCITVYAVERYEELTFICGGRVPQKIQKAYRKNLEKMRKRG